MSNITDAFSHIIGNDTIKLQLQMAIQAAQLRNTAIANTILCGHPGTGKSTTARALAQATGTDFFRVPVDGVKKPEDFLKIFNKFSTEGYDENGNKIGTIKPSIFFVDELHSMSLKAQEILGIAMEDGIIDCKVPSEYSDEERVATFWIPEFCVVGATTLLGRVSKPLRDRFSLFLHYNQYSQEECEEITKFHTNKEGYVIEADAAKAIASRGRGTPRILVHFVSRLIEAATIADKKLITKDMADNIFNLIGVDNNGLREVDIDILKTLYQLGEPVGLEVLAVVSATDQKTIIEEIEPFLIKSGFMIRSKRGRKITNKGKAYLEENGYAEKKKNSRLLKMGD